MLIALPICLNCIEEDVPTFVILLFMFSTGSAILCYFMLACSNPGFIMGSGSDVERRAGAYDPKDYQVESDRKVKQAELESHALRAVKSHNRKLSFLTQKLTTKSRQNARSHFELPPLAHNGTPPNN